MDVYREPRKHTPGPWEYFQGCICFGSPEDRRIIVGTDIARVPEADSILMAAAPELLASLKEVLADASWELERPIIKRAEAVIAKAEGR